MIKNKRLTGYALAVTAAVFWGCGSIAAKFALNAGITPLGVMKLRMSGAALCGLLVLLLYAPRQLRLAPGSVKTLLLASVPGLFLMQISYFWALNLAGVATAVFLLYLAPLFVTLYGVATGREKMNRVKTVALTLSLAGGGCVAFAGGAGGVSLTGIAFGLLSGLCYACNTVYGGKLSASNPLAVMFYTTLIAAAGAFLLPPYALYLEKWLLLPWWVPLYIAVFFAFAPLTLFYAALRFLPAGNVSIVCNLEPVVAVICAVLVLGEQLSSLQVAGGVMIIAAVLVLQAGARLRRRKKA